MKRKKTYHMWRGHNLTDRVIWITKKNIIGSPIHYYKRMGLTPEGYDSTSLAERKYDDIWKITKEDTYIGPISEADLMLELL